MRLPRSRILPALLLAPLVAVAGLPSASATPVSPQQNTIPLTPVLNGVSTGPAKQALEDAENALTGKTLTAHQAGSETSSKSGGHFDVTSALANLQSHLTKLQGEDRTRAEQLLARPTSKGGDYLGPGATLKMNAAKTRLYGTKHILVHYVTSGKNKATKAWAKRTARTFEHAWKVEVGRLGFRHPKSDKAVKDPDNVDGRVDVFLMNVGSYGYYGYAAADNPGKRRSPAYLVLDNDFSRKEFGARPANSLKVTAAHEFFHTIQMNYRNQLGKWLWFSEGSAVWVEDRVYNGVNDYLQYVPASPIRRPRTPFTSDNGLSPYGEFAVFTYLTAHYHDRAFVRGMWVRVANKKSPMVALRRTLRAHDATLEAAVRDFGMWNTLRKGTYPERKSYLPAGWWKQHMLTPAHPSMGWQEVTVKWLSTAPLRLRPAPKLAKGSRVVIEVDGPDKSLHPAADVQVRRQNGTVTTTTLELDADGKASRDFRFGHRVKSVVVTLTNAANGHPRKFRVRAHVD